MYIRFCKKLTILWQNETLKLYIKIGIGKLTQVEMLNKDKGLWCIIIHV
jgi:hypothetical protein